MKIKVFYEGVPFRLRGWRKIKSLVIKVISEEGKFSGDLNFIIAGDEYIREINRKFLNHDWYTDVISFNYGESSGLNGEIFISIDTVRINAINYKVSYKEELLRVIIHGVLHLCGYEDKNKEQKDKMNIREDYWMKRRGEE